MCNGSTRHAGCVCRRHYHDFPERGWIQFLILRLVFEAPMHGYQLMEELERRGFLLSRRIESGSIYTILRRMERKGLLVSEWERVETGPDRRIYRITDEGVETLRLGLEAVVMRKAIMDDLASFYSAKFKQARVDPDS
ncbi:MAG: PadR family transcriptional regulator [Candidatus Bathyarchaeia archaeon]